MSDNPFQGEYVDDEAQFQPIPDAEAPPVASAPSAASTQGMSKLQQLRAREAELLRRQQLLNESRAEIITMPNWPPFYPLIIYDPDRDLPKRSHECVKSALYGLIAVVASVLFNCLAVLCVWGLPGYHHVRCFIFAIIQGFGTFYVVFNYSFTKLYYACRAKDVPFSWVVTQFCLFGWLVYLTIGFPDSGCVGLATFLDLVAKSDHTFSMLMAFLNTGLVGAAAYFQMMALYQTQAYQKVSGHDETARDEQPLNP